MEGYNQDSGTGTVRGYNEGLWDRDSWRLQSLTQGQGQWEVTITDSETGTVGYNH